MENIVKNNRIIAEFMGIKFKSATKKYPYDEIIYPDSFNLPFDESDDTDDIIYFKFHYSWDWLMPVVIKIESLDVLGGIVRIIQGQCKITSRMLGDHSVYSDRNNYLIHGANGKLLSTYEAVVEFIKWYNKQNKQ